MKRFKIKYDFKFLWFHFKGTVSTYKYGWKKKVKKDSEQVEIIFEKKVAL